MLRGYLLVLSSGSSIDRTSNNVSLFNLIEVLGLQQEALGEVIPELQMHLHVIVEPSARNSDFEARIMRVEAQGHVEAGNSFGFRTGEGAHLRVVTGFRLPRGYGDYLLHAEWRRKGEETWNADGATWPLQIRPFVASDNAL